MPGAAHAQYPLEFVREDLDETRQHVHPVIENVFGALASRQFEMALDQPVNQLHIARLDYRLQIDGSEIGALLGEISALIKHVSDAAAHASREIPSAGAEHDHQSVRHVLAAVVANTFHHGRSAGVAHREPFPGNPAEECFSAGCAIEHNVADENVFFRGKTRLLRRVDDEATARKALANVVVGIAFESHGYALGQKCAEALARRARELDA